MLKSYSSGGDSKQALGEAVIIEIEDGCGKKRSFVAAVSQLLSLGSYRGGGPREFIYINMHEARTGRAEKLISDILNGRVTGFDTIDDDEGEIIVDSFGLIDRKRRNDPGSKPAAKPDIEEIARKPSMASSTPIVDEKLTQATRPVISIDSSQNKHRRQDSATRLAGPDPRRANRCPSEVWNGRCADVSKVSRGKVLPPELLESCRKSEPKNKMATRQSRSTLDSEPELIEVKVEAGEVPSHNSSIKIKHTPKRTGEDYLSDLRRKHSLFSSSGGSAPFGGPVLRTADLPDGVKIVEIINHYFTQSSSRPCMLVRFEGKNSFEKVALRDVFVSAPELAKLYIRKVKSLRSVKWKYLERKLPVVRMFIENESIDLCIRHLIQQENKLMRERR